MLVASGISQSLTAEATSAGEVQGQIDQHTNELNNANQRVVALETEQEILQEQIDDFNAELANTMASIGAMEDELAAKEQELAAKEGEIVAKEEEIERKKQQIEQTQAEYEAAVAREEAQRENMAVCARMMYERGEESYLDALLEGKGFQAEAVYDGEAGREYALLGVYDLLILDVALPDGSGFQVCEAVRRRDAKIPILFLTAAD